MLDGLRLRAFCALFFVLTAAGCQSADRQLLATGPDASLSGSKIRAFAANQSEVVEAVSEMAGLGRRQPVTAPEWRSFVFAGINYVDSQCNAYLSALDQFYRARNVATQQIALMGAATAGILGVVGAAAQAISITAISFGLAGATVDNLSKGLIYDLPATAVIQLVRDMQQSYKAGIPPTGYPDRPGAFLAIQGYVDICLPVTIETQIANAVRIAKPEVRAGDPERGLAPIVQIGTITTTTYGADQNTAVLRAYLFRPDGTIDPDRQSALQASMAKFGVSGVPSSVFIRAQEYQAVRQQVVTDLTGPK